MAIAMLSGMAKSSQKKEIRINSNGMYLIKPDSSRLLRSVTVDINTPADDYDQGFEDGKKSEYDVFWDTFQDNGSRTSYQYGFAALALTWTDDIYNPKYPIVCDNMNAYTATGLFNGNTNITDTKVPITISGTRADTCFHNCTRLKRIPSLTLKNLTRFSQTFQNCHELEELNMHGNIDINGLDLHWSEKLSRASIENIISCLSTSTSGLSVTLSKAAVNLAFGSAESDEWKALVATKSNWTISLV